MSFPSWRARLGHVGLKSFILALQRFEELWLNLLTHIRVSMTLHADQKIKAEVVVITTVIAYCRQHRQKSDPQIVDGRFSFRVFRDSGAMLCSVSESLRPVPILNVQRGIESRAGSSLTTGDS
jgi:hypothetical protein